MKDLSGRRPQSDRIGLRPFRPDHSEQKIPAVIWADEPGIGRSPKAMCEPDERRDIKAGLRIPEIERGSEGSDSMQREVARLRETGPIRKAKALMQCAFKRGDHQTRIAHGERPIAGPLRPRSVRRESFENMPRGREAFLDQLYRNFGVSFQYGKRRN